MAASAKHISLLFCLLCLASSLQIQALPFRKALRYYEVKETKVNGNGITPDVQEVPTTFTPQSKNGYGLYGNGPEEFPPSTTGKSPSKFPTNEFAENYENKESRFGNVNNEYQNKQYGMSDNEYQNEQYGMSDTRYMENGKYFYDVNAERSRNRYESWKGNGQELESSEWVDNSNKELETSGVVDTRNKYSYGGSGNSERNKYNNGGYENRERSKYNYGGYGNNERSKYNYGTYENTENGDEFKRNQNQEEYEP